MPQLVTAGTKMSMFLIQCTGRHARIMSRIWVARFAGATWLKSTPLRLRWASGLAEDPARSRPPVAASKSGMSSLESPR